MTDTGDDFARLMERVRDGCPVAIAEMLERYGGHIREVVRRQLHQRLRGQFDSLDFQQDVWASFFCGEAGRYTFDSAEALVKLLSEIARNKVVEVFRHRLQTTKRNLNREQSMDQLHFGKLAPHVAARNPSPSQLAIANEQWERLIDKMPPHYQRILDLLRQDYTHLEIAEKLRCSPKMVQRVLLKLKEQGVVE